MSILAMTSENQALCDKFDLYELGTAYIVTMPNGYRFVCTRLNIEELAPLVAEGATIEVCTELGA